MSHFNLKSLGFYGVAIGSVVVLFNIVNAYGANLKAPPAINGQYPISLKNLAGCETAEDLVLTIEQSGIYLSGNLLTAESLAQITGEEKPALMGQLDNQNLTLSGSVPQSKICRQPEDRAATQLETVNIQGKIEGETLNGKITISSNAVDFNAQRKAPPKKDKKH